MGCRQGVVGGSTEEEGGQGEGPAAALYSATLTAIRARRDLNHHGAVTGRGEGVVAQVFDARVHEAHLQEQARKRRRKGERGGGGKGRLAGSSSGVTGKQCSTVQLCRCLQGHRVVLTEKQASSREIKLPMKKGRALGTPRAPAPPPPAA